MPAVDEPEWRRRLSTLAGRHGGVAALARLAGLPTQTVRNHLARTSKTPYVHLRQIALAVGIDAEWLLAEESGAPSSHRPAGCGEGADLIPYDPDDSASGNASAPDHPMVGQWTVVSRALDLAGFLPGDVVEFAIGAEPRPGEVVVAQVYDPHRPQAETVLRVWLPPFLVVRTADSSIDQRPLEVDAAGERVKIMGAFLRLRRERR